jgi:hypothetical protein
MQTYEAEVKGMVLNGQTGTVQLQVVDKDKKPVVNIAFQYADVKQAQKFEIGKKITITLK